MKYTFNNEHWKEIVAHVWSGTYLLKNYGAYFRKFSKILSKAQTCTSTNWAGTDVWGSPVVSLAPPISFYNKSNVIITNRYRNEARTKILCS